MGESAGVIKPEIRNSKFEIRNKFECLNDLIRSEASRTHCAWFWNRHQADIVQRHPAVARARSAGVDMLNHFSIIEANGASRSFCRPTIATTGPIPISMDFSIDWAEERRRLEQRVVVQHCNIPLLASLLRLLAAILLRKPGSNPCHFRLPPCAILLCDRSGPRRFQCWRVMDRSAAGRRLQAALR
jgi:hypothetical protein